jgi:hypothetical protein
MTIYPVIMVQISDREWTAEALHCACLLARNTSARIALVDMVPVQHAGWLGTDLGYLNFTDQKQVDFADYQATIEDYGVEFVPVLFQYLDLPDAIAQAAEHMNAQIVFAKLPESGISFWTKFQRWLLNRQFAREKRQWIQHPVYELEASNTIIEAASEIGFLAEHPAH